MSAYNDDGDWVEDGDPNEDDDDDASARSESHVEEFADDSIVAELNALRLERATASERADLLEAQIAAAKAGETPDEAPAATGVELLMQQTQRGPEFLAMVEDLKSLAEDRKARAAAVEAAAASVVEEELTWDAELLSDRDFKALRAVCGWWSDLDARVDGLGQLAFAPAKCGCQVTTTTDSLRRPSVHRCRCGNPTIGGLLIQSPQGEWTGYCCWSESLRASHPELASVEPAVEAEPIKVAGDPLTNAPARRRLGA